MKKAIALSCSAVMALSLAACSSQTGKDWSNQQVTGKITAVNGTSITLQLGELKQKEMEDQSGQTPPEMPEGDSQSGQTPPEKPEGDSQNGQTPPEKPEGDSQNGQTPPEKPEGDSQNGFGVLMVSTAQEFEAGEETATFSLKDAVIQKEEDGQTKEVSIDDLKTDDVVSVKVGSSNKAETVTILNLNQGMPFGSGSFDQGTAANTIDQDGEYDGTYTSSGDDENALRVTGAKVTLKDITVDKTGGSSSNTETGDFYGMNAGLLATDGADVTITNAKVNTDAKNGNGVFSYGTGTKVSISDSQIITVQDNSGGIQTTGGATTIAKNLTVVTDGNSSAAIRSDRGGGTVDVEEGSYTSKGYNSPAVYSTADITVKNAKLTAENSEALVIEGKNSITLENCEVSGNMSDDKGSASAENVHNVMIYQSMSGDADVGTSKFTMNGGKLINNNGDLFYFTNTSAEMNLTGVELVNNETDGYLMRVVGNSESRGWGKAGSNGAQVTFKAKDQKMDGNILVDTISSLNMTLEDGTVFTGTVSVEDNKAGGTAVDNNAVITVEKGAVWKLTGDCRVTSVENNGTIDFNGYTITLADGTVLK